MALVDQSFGMPGLMSRYGSMTYPQQRGLLASPYGKMVSQYMQGWAKPSYDFGSSWNGNTASPAGSAGGSGVNNASPSVASNPASQASVPATPANVANVGLGLASAATGGIGGLLGMVANQAVGKSPSQSVVGKGLMGLMGMLGLDPGNPGIAQAIAAISPETQQAVADAVAAASVGMSPDDAANEASGVGVGVW
jgi:hypothetical protein